jgi:hypothetical protein
MREANCDGDHFLIRTIIRHKISRTNRCINLDGIYISWTIKKKNDYQEYITEKLKNKQKKQDMNEEWTNIKSVILEAAKIEIGELGKERNQNWYDEECQIVMKEKHEARKRCLNKETRKNREEYEEKRKIATKLCRRREKCGTRK